MANAAIFLPCITDQKAMRSRYHKPHSLLTGYVRTVLTLEGDVEPDADALPLFTNGMPALLCRMEKDAQGKETVTQLCLFGKSAPLDCWIVDSRVSVIAYFFQPFVLAALFDLPASQIKDSPVDLGHWNPHKAMALRTQLICAGTASGKTAALDHLLVQQVQQQSRECAIIRHASDRILCDPGKEVLSDILNELKLNERTFQRLFKKYVGITASQYRRICQFQRSFAQLRGAGFDSLTDVAYDNGFADQSHFTRTFREFTQTTPNGYLRSGLKRKG